ncbi:hypothetical protein EON66_11290 [archaeon]|nr:MAG: hypothetical protein EON66_11290 [archaeon]
MNTCLCADLLKSTSPASLRGKMTHEQFLRECKQRDRARQEEEEAAAEEEEQEEEGDDFFASYFGFDRYAPPAFANSCACTHLHGAITSFPPYPKVQAIQFV